jgi:TolB protein
LKHAWIAALVLFAVSLAHAQVTIVIDRGYDNPKKIAVVPFGVGANLDVENPAGVIGFDLARSGQFAPLPQANMLSMPVKQEEVIYRDWRVLGVEYLVIGHSEVDFDGKIAVVYQLYDVLNQRQLISERLKGDRATVRDMAHMASDAIYEKITGIRGAFSTKIVYVLVNGLGTKAVHYKLEMADVDGARPRTLLESQEPILSAVWSPDAKQIAYVSFEKHKPCIFLQTIATGERVMLTDFTGLNGAPEFSPDGRRLALVLSKDGNPEIYVMDIATRALTRVTRYPSAINTEPSWSADGKSLIFTSDRGGKPQIYKVAIASGLTERITFDGDWNARGRLLPDGRHLVFVHRVDGVDHLALLDIEKDRTMVLTETSLDESPSIAPNGTMLIYATQDRGRGILAVVSIDGRVKYRLPSAAGDVREPDWSPFLHSPG